MPILSGGRVLVLPWNRAAFQAINDLACHTPWLHAGLIGYAEYGVAIFAVLLLMGWWLARRHREPAGMAAALWAGAGMLAAVGLNQFLVAAAAEPRPYTVLHHSLLLIPRSADYAFPSDHAVMAGAVAAGLVLVANRTATAWLGWVASVAALLMAFARVYVGTHWPGDVIAGLLFGAAVILVGWLLLHAVLAWLCARLADSPLAPLVSAAPHAEATSTLCGTGRQDGP